VYYLSKNPLAGEMYEGQLMETLFSIEINKCNNIIEDVKKLLSEISLKIEEFDWACDEDLEEYSNLLKKLQKITKTK